MGMSMLLDAKFERWQAELAPAKSARDTSFLISETIMHLVGMVSETDVVHQNRGWCRNENLLGWTAGTTI
jgi:hypothetical protein